MTKLKKYVPWCIVFFLVVLLFIIILKHYQISKNEAKTIYVKDTITKVEWDTVYLEHWKTVKLPVTDTTLYCITDTIRLIDSVEVEIPINHYALDTTFTTDTSSINLGIRCSGYDVSLDTISYNFKYIARPVVVEKNFFKEHFKAGVGISGGYGVINKKADIYVGAGFFFVF